MRGSVPAHWAQDISKIQPKPPIFIETNDPSSSLAGKHFNKLLARLEKALIEICMYENHDIAIAMSSSLADPVLGLNIRQG